MGMLVIFFVAVGLLFGRKTAAAIAILAAALEPSSISKQVGKRREKTMTEFIRGFILHSPLAHGVESWRTHWWAEWTAFLDATPSTPPLLAFLLSCVLGWLIAGRIQRAWKGWKDLVEERGL